MLIRWEGIGYSAFQINHPPPWIRGGEWQPSVIRQRGGVGLLNVHLCAWGWGWRASVMQHPGGVGGFGWSSWSGGGVGKTCQGGVGAVACGRGGSFGCKTQLSQSPSQMSIPNPHTHSPNPQGHPQSPSPMPIPNPHTHPSPQCPSPILIPIPKPNSRCPSQLPIPNAHPQSPSRISASCRVGGGMENLMDFCCHTGGLARGCHAVLRGGCRLGQPPSAQEGGMEAGCHAPNHPPLD